MKGAPVELTINPDGTVLLDGQLIVDRDLLESKFQEFAKQEPRREIHVRPTKEVRYQTVADILRIVQKVGLRVGFVMTERPATPEPPN